jgi:hypothetical protein
MDSRQHSCAGKHKRLPQSTAEQVAKWPTAAPLQADKRPARPAWVDDIAKEHATGVKAPARVLQMPTGASA